jgi:hypothetical protein
MKNPSGLVVPLVLVLLAFAALGFDDQDTKLIGAYIASQARRERGEEYKEARRIATGDLNHDGIPDVAVLYTIEGQRGTNHSVQYLAVFVRSNGKLVVLARAEVGGKGGRSVELKSIDDNTLHFETLDYAPKDPACCPSEKGETSYVLAGTVLKELKKIPSRGK